MSKEKSLWERFVSLILPSRCAVTGQIVDGQGMMSSAAWGALHFIAPPCCHACGVPFDVDSVEIEPDGLSSDADSPLYGQSYFKCAGCMADPPPYGGLRSAVAYNDTSRALVLSFKHGDQTHLTATFVPWLKALVEQNEWSADYIIPVPLHWTRLLKRRYNQSALLARALAKSLSVPVALDMLVRSRATVTQGHLSSKDRHENVRGAFTLHPRFQTKIAGKTILLIDDVYTTGATIKECARVLKAHGAACVLVLTVARVLRDGAGA